MANKKMAWIFAIIILFNFAFAQDTLKILQYNLMYYGLYTDFCTQTNNNLADKTNYLKTIIQYTQPDIFGVNEINGDDYAQQYLLENVFYDLGMTYFAKSQNFGTNGYLTTQIYYNTKKLVEQKAFTISAYPRPIVVHKFYLRTSGLENGDTIFLYIAEAHLKAGTYSTDSIDRANATANFMAYVTNQPVDNYIFMGDLNLYTAAEQAYQNLVNPSNPTYKFYDPAPAGDWHNNPDFALYHTQSTSYYGDDCKAAGGLDDRFDFILYSEPIYSGSKKIKADPNSFKVIGQDGQHFNSGVDYQGNNSVPPEVLSALASNSDHLPVAINLLVYDKFANINSFTIYQKTDFKILQNPITNNQISLQITNNNLLYKQKLNYKIVNLYGQTIQTGYLKINPNNIFYSIQLKSELQSGLYILLLQTDNYITTQNFLKL